MQDFLQDTNINMTEDQFNEVFSSVGLCLYLAQCLEHNIVTMLLFLDFVPKGLESPETKARWKEEFEKYEQDVWRLTLGKLIGKMKAVGDPEDELFRKLEACLERRNWFTHHFVRDRAANLFTEAGRIETLRIVESDKALFKETSDILTERVLRQLESNGYSRERIFQKVAGLISGAGSL